MILNIAFASRKKRERSSTRMSKDRLMEETQHISKLLQQPKLRTAGIHSVAYNFMAKKINVHSPFGAGQKSNR